MVKLKIVSFSIGSLTEDCLMELRKRTYKPFEWEDIQATFGIAPFLSLFFKRMGEDGIKSEWIIEAIITKLEKTVPSPLYSSVGSFIREACNEKYSRYKRKGSGKKEINYRKYEYIRTPKKLRPNYKPSNFLNIIPREYLLNEFISFLYEKGGMSPAAEIKTIIGHHYHAAYNKIKKFDPELVTKSKEGKGACYILNQDIMAKYLEVNI